MTRLEERMEIVKEVGFMPGLTIEESNKMKDILEKEGYQVTITVDKSRRHHNREIEIKKVEEVKENKVEVKSEETILTKAEIKRLKKWLAPLNQEELKEDIKLCKEYLKSRKTTLEEKARIIIDSYGMLLYYAKLRTYDDLEIIKKIETAFNN